MSAAIAGDLWHLDEVAVKIVGLNTGSGGSLTRTGSCVTSWSRADAKAAAERLLRKRLKKQTRPLHVMITDKLSSYAAVKKNLLSSFEHRQQRAEQPGREFTLANTTTRTAEGASSLPGRHNGSSLPMTEATTSSFSAAITFLPSNIEAPEPKRFKSQAGITSVARRA